MTRFSSHRRPAPGAAARPHAPSPAETGAAMLADAPAPGAAATALLKRYRPLETRGGGTFGTVEICLDVRLKRRVAIKRMPLADEGAAADVPLETYATALAEARTASMLAASHIVQVIDFTYDRGYAYLVMEYVDGMSLEELLAAVDGHSLTYDETAAVADALVQALAFAHDNGVLHLDVKPANVLIDRTGNVKLADFGMAKLSRATGYGDARGGTIGYMPPEQLIGADVDGRADLFALAAVLYEALCAEAPFRAESAAASIERIREGAEDPAEVLPGIPELADEVLLTALSSAPEDRPESVEAFGERFLADLGNPRAGRRSLANLIAELTADEDDVDLAPEAAKPAVEVDPAEGWLGSRTPRARALVTGGIAGAGVAVAAAYVLGMTGVASPVATLAVALATGGASVAAPQLGSALVAAGLICAVAPATPLLALLPVLLPLIALLTSWWYVWGRTQPAASAAFAAILAAGALTGNPWLLAGPIAVWCGYLSAPGVAAATVGLGVLTSALFNTALGAAGALPASAAWAAIADGHLIAGAAGAAATAAVVSAVGSRLWERFSAGGGTGLDIVCAASGGIMVVLQLCLANPVENTSSQTLPFAVALGMGALSSIIWLICTYGLGYRKETAEGDRP